VTTYVATVRQINGVGEYDDVTFAYCSAVCRLTEGSRFDRFRDDRAYEFEERCAACGDRISGVNNADQDVWTYAASEVLTVEEASRRLRARYESGIKEVY
jgi:hypothetical protein